MLAVDTNILVYAANTRSPFHPACRRWLDRQRSRRDAWYATWPIIYEFLRVTTHPRLMRPAWGAAQAWEFISALLVAPGLGILVATHRHADVADQVLRELPHLSGSLFDDAHTAILMREHGIRRISTRDTGFHRFPFLEVIDPVTL